jgi:hypothetical protein
MFLRILLAANRQAWKNHSPGLIAVCSAFVLYDFLKGLLTPRVGAIDVAVFAGGYAGTVCIYMAASWAVYFWPPKKAP